MNTPSTRPPAAPDARLRRLAVQDNCVSSRELLDAQGLLIIEHHGKHYQLRETRNGKLILTS